MNKINKVFLLLASLILGACRSSVDDNNNDNTPSGYSVETVSEAPAWQVDFSGTDTRPDWKEPNPADYENWTIMLVQLEDALIPYTSEGDLMALFVGSELRGLTSPAVLSDDTDSEADKGAFVLKAYGNEADQNLVSVTLRYYCSQLKQTFSRTEEMTYNMGKVYGLDENLIPQFTLGSPKYPVVTHLTITAADLSPINATFGSGDMLAAFADGECRGVTTFNSLPPAPDQGGGLSTFNSLTVFGRQEGEAYTLKYYNAATQRVYTLSKSF